MPIDNRRPRSVYVLPPRPAWAVRRRRRTDAIKALGLGLTVLLVSTMPAWSLPFFLYSCGAVAALAGLFLFALFLDVWVGFHRFERLIAAAARRLFGPRPYVRMVRR